MPRTHWLVGPELNKICFFIGSRSTKLSQPGLRLRRDYNSQDRGRLARLFKRDVRERRRARMLGVVDTPGGLGGQFRVPLIREPYVGRSGPRVVQGL